MITELEDSLQHFGVKGMKWGVRRSKRKSANAKVAKDLKSGKITKKEARDKKLDNYHRSKNGVASVYRSNYDDMRSYGLSHRTSMRLAKASSQIQKGVLVAPFALSAFGLGRVAVRKTIRSIDTPDNIRMGKNIIQAMKRSPIRYVDGSKIKDAIDMAGGALVRR